MTYSGIDCWNSALYGGLLPAGAPLARPTMLEKCILTANPLNLLRIYWSRREDLNPRPADYKSAALPTELRRRQPEWLEAHCMRPGNLPQSIHNSRVVRVYRGVVSGSAPRPRTPAAALPPAPHRASKHPWSGNADPIPHQIPVS